METKLIKIIFVVLMFFVFSSLLEWSPVKSYVSQVCSKAFLQIYHYNYKSEKMNKIELRYSKDQTDIVKQLESPFNDFNELGVTWFGNTEMPNLKIFIVKSTKLPHPILKSSNGIFLPENNIIAIKGNLSDQERLHAIAHEYAHFYLMNYITSQNMKVADFPDWFHEGIAEAFAHRFAPLPFLEATDSWDVVPLTEMDMRNPKLGTKLNERYIMAQFTVEKLINDYGTQVITELISQTEKKGSFSDGFSEITGQDLSTYGDFLEPNYTFIENQTKKMDKGEYNEVKKELLNFDEEQAPYYYEAPLVYNLLNTIYVEQKNWDDAISIVMKRMYYSPTSSVDWKMASEYAANMNDYKSAIKYAKKAVDLTDSTSGSSFEEWLAQLQQKN